jgi:putative transposase
MRRYSEAVKADVKKRVSPTQRQSVEQIYEELCNHMVTINNYCEIGTSLRTLRRGQKAYLGNNDGHDRRKSSRCLFAHRLSNAELQRILLTYNQPQYASLPETDAANSC